MKGDKISGFGQVVFALTFFDSFTRRFLKKSWIFEAHLNHTIWHYLCCYPLGVNHIDLRNP
jgi:hypothetical protein